MRSVSAMEISRLGSDEVERFRAIRLRALQDSPSAFGTTFESAQAWTLDEWTRLLGSLVAFVARRGDTDVGMVRVAADSDSPDAARLGSLWVDPEARSAGVGTALIDEAVAWARSRGFNRLLLDVADHNPAAVATYARKGFEPTGRVAPFPAPRGHLRKHERSKALR